MSESAEEQLLPCDQAPFGAGGRAVRHGVHAHEQSSAGAALAVVQPRDQMTRGIANPPEAPLEKSPPLPRAPRRSRHRQPAAHAQAGRRPL